jgi:hypothetical protein
MYAPTARKRRLAHGANHAPVFAEVWLELGLVSRHVPYNRIPHQGMVLLRAIQCVADGPELQGHTDLCNELAGYLECYKASASPVDSRCLLDQHSSIMAGVEVYIRTWQLPSPTISHMSKRR